MKTILIFLAILLMGCVPILAQPGMGARPAGMGNAFVGLADDGNAAIWNPA